MLKTGLKIKLVWFVRVSCNTNNKIVFFKNFTAFKKLQKCKIFARLQFYYLRSNFKEEDRKKILTVLAS